MFRMHARANVDMHHDVHGYLDGLHVSSTAVCHNKRYAGSERKPTKPNPRSLGHKQQRLDS